MGGILPLALAPGLRWLLPETLQREERAQGMSRAPVWESLFAGGRATPTLLLWLAFLPTLLIPARLPFMNLRNHRKLLVVDGKVGFTGGMNIREHFLPGHGGPGPAAEDRVRFVLDHLGFRQREPGDQRSRRDAGPTSGHPRLRGRHR